MIIMYNVKRRPARDVSPVPMKVSRQQLQENRRAILDAAGRLFRQRGFDAVSVSEVMKAAGLTHGAFYGYFQSKDDLVAASLAQLTTGEREPVPRSERIARYLSPEHRENRESGCPVAALAPECPRQSPAARAAMTEGVRRMVAGLVEDAPGGAPAERRQAAIGAVATMVGGLILARAVDSEDLSDELLAGVRAWLSAGGDPTLGG